LPPEINQSDWKYLLEWTPNGKRALRMGLRATLGLGESGWERILAARSQAKFSSLRDFCERTRLPQATVSNLVRAGLFDAFGSRRKLLWELGEIDYRPEELPLVLPVMDVPLPELQASEESLWEYELLGLSPNGQLMRHYRPALERAGVLSTAEVKAQPEGEYVRIGGMVAVKQRPGTAKGMVFISLEDETSLVDVVVRPNVYEKFLPLLRHQLFVLVEGVIQRGSGAISVLVTRALEFRSVAGTIGEEKLRPPTAPDEYSPEYSARPS
jgi:error-prone DNA polymerase